ncbi:MAG TPA: TonB-dependent receptor plug domain-containing protein [Bryobacteraceae bacterium]|nr:TonB-dependent receptor plug domain-containing protein [Bryobacteraceae bacterium]
MSDKLTVTRTPLLLCLEVFMIVFGCHAASDAGSDASLDLEQLMDVRVQTATLQKQTLRDAPADVTIVTAADIRRYGYRTLGEALMNVRGFYITQDGAFQFAGVRGFSLLGDYNTRFLVMIDGHPLTDNVYGAMYMFGQDFGLDMDLVDQIEIVRGPSSALYGSNGMFATINILTKKAGATPTRRVSTELGSFGESKLIASSTFTFGGSGSVLVSASGFYAGGRKVTLPDGDVDVDRLGLERGVHTFTNVTWKNWNFIALWGDRNTAAPLGFYGADVGDTGTTSRDNRNFAEISWSRAIGTNAAVRWRAHYDQYRYDGIYQYRELEHTRNFDGAAGDWVGQQLIYQQRTSRLGSLTLGTEASFDIRNLQYGYSDIPGRPDSGAKGEFRLKHPNAGYAVFAQHEIDLGRRFTMYLGGRIDGSKNNGVFLSPRVALIYKQSTTSYKAVFGQAFRNPSTFERYWEPNPELTAERMNTVEFSREQTIRKRLTLVTSVFHYRLRDLIAGVAVSGQLLQYRNTSRASASGLEVELTGQPTKWLNLGGSVAVQATKRSGDDRQIENSPQTLAQFRASMPLASDRVVPGFVARHLAARTDAYGGVVPAATLLDVTASSRKLGRNLDMQFGVRNLLDTRYADPLSSEHIHALLPRAGRTWFVKLTWQSE